MASTKNYLAIDLGAESGRTIVGSFDGQRLTINETHRFPNKPVQDPSGLHWDIDQLWNEIVKGIKISSESYSLSSLAIDTWGVDFALLDEQGALLEAPYHYRDSRTDGIMEDVFELIAKEEIYAQTGIQFMQFNSLYQLYSLVKKKAAILNEASTFLTIPDLFNYWFTGEKCCEFTNATTTQCLNPVSKKWAKELLAELSIPVDIFPNIIQPGTVIGSLQDNPVAEKGLPAIPVVAPACHDTGSAVAAVPAIGENFAWLSSGTWSILGVETAEPYLEKDALENSFTNEGGVNGTWRLSKNIMGLWIIQECKREWGISYDEITQLAEAAQPFLAVIDPDADDFFYPGQMVVKVQEFCQNTQQAVPQSRGEVARVVLESLALKYRYLLEKLESMTGKVLEPIHIIGGGSQNALLNQLTADCTGKNVVTGPIEATAIGNILMQAIAMGDISNLQAGRKIIKNSFSTETYSAHQTAEWDDAYTKLQNLLMGI